MSAITLSEVSEARQAWIDAVQATDVDRTVALYDPEVGRLLGTLDTKDTTDRSTLDGIRDYFVHFLSNDRVEARFPTDIPPYAVTQLGDGFAAYSGYYDFLLEKDGVAKLAHAKFTYIYRRTASGLKIVTHNSGLTPEGITPA